MALPSTAPARPVPSAADALDPTADAQRRLDEMLDLLRREQAQSPPPAAAPPAAAAPEAAAPEAPHADEASERLDTEADTEADTEVEAEAEADETESPVAESPVVETAEAEPAEPVLVAPIEETAHAEFVLDEPATDELNAVELTIDELTAALTADEPEIAEQATVEPRRETSALPPDDPFRSLAGLGLAKPAGAAAPARPPLRSLLSEMFELDLSDVNDADEGEDEGIEPTLVFEADADAAVAADATPEEEGETERMEEDVPEEDALEEEAAPVVAAAPAAPAAEDSVDRSVDDYMEALLARMRQSREEVPTPLAPKPRPRPSAAAKPLPAKPAPAAPSPLAGSFLAGGTSASLSSQSARPPAAAVAGAPALTPLPPPPSLPRSRVDKEKLREEMRQLRAIANTSARSAVMESTWKRTRARLVMAVLMCGVALGLGLVLILTSVWGHAVHYGLGGALCLAAVWIARDFGRTMDLLRRQKIAATKAAAAEAAEAGVAPHEAGERALNVPSAA